jgi:hypothetical protein
MYKNIFLFTIYFPFLYFLFQNYHIFSQFSLNKADEQIFKSF